MNKSTNLQPLTRGRDERAREGRLYMVHAPHCWGTGETINVAEARARAAFPAGYWNRTGRRRCVANIYDIPDGTTVDDLLGLLRAPDGAEPIVRVGQLHWQRFRAD